MLILNCTKAAADFFSTTQKGKKISPIEPAPHKTIAESVEESVAELISEPMAKPTAPLQWQWLVHAIKVKGKNVLVMMDYHSRFSITLSALKKGDDMAFLNNFEHHLIVHVHEIMTAINIDSQAIDASLERFRHQHNSCAFYLRGDGSVQSHINDVACRFRDQTDELGYVPTEVELIDHDAFVNQLLRKRKTDKDYFFPQHEFLRAWLRDYGEYSAAQVDECIEQLNAKERAEFAARHPGLVQACENKNTPLSSDDPIQPQTQTKTHKALDNNVIALDAYRKK